MKWLPNNQEQLEFHLLEVENTMETEMVLNATKRVSKIEQVRSWLAPFGEHVLKSIFDNIDSQFINTHVIGPTHEFAEFGLNPTRMLNRAFSILDRISRELNADGNILLLIDTSLAYSLTKVEAMVVFGFEIAINIIEEVQINKIQRRLVILGVPRAEKIALTFHYSSAIQSKNLSNILNLFENHFPIAGLYLTYDQASALLERRNYDTFKILQKLIGIGKISLGLSIPKARIQLALSDMRNEIQPLQVISHVIPVQLVRFDDTNCFFDKKNISSILKDAGIVADTSFDSFQVDYSTDIRGLDLKSYFSYGAYQPQCFDHRIPTGIWRDDGIIELIPLKLASSCKNPIHRRDVVYGQPFTLNWLHQSVSAQRLLNWVTDQSIDQDNPWMFDNVDELWNFRSQLFLSALPKLLDFKSKRLYLKGLENYHSFKENFSVPQSYHEHMVYNWYACDPKVRTTVIDCGKLDDEERIQKIISDLQLLKKQKSFRFQIVNQFDLMDAAIEESKSRVSNISDSLSNQIVDHTYLKDAALLPLREDLEVFTDFIPKFLNRVLEIGSGYGQLANILAARGTNYICVDLNPEMFINLNVQNNIEFLVADFHRIPIENSSIDTVIANNVLEHSYDPLSALIEIRRILCPGGFLYVLIPLDKLGAEHNLSTHLWKVDRLSIELACNAADLNICRFEIVDYYKLKIFGAFPTCNGLGAMVEIQRPIELDGDQG